MQEVSWMAREEEREAHSTRELQVGLSEGAFLRNGLVWFIYHLFQ